MIGLLAHVDTARLLRKAAIDYVQLKIQRTRSSPPDRPQLLRVLQQAVSRACAEGFLRADDRAVAWFADYPGLTVRCTRSAASAN